jgi:hypothetical protein
MKITDFRIGNLVRDKYSKGIIKVNGITENDIFFSGNFTKEWQAEPIPITEEWLLNFGFKKTEYNSDIIYDSELQNSTYITIDNDYSSYFMWGEYLTSIKYVHELQNLYYALTKEELILCELN